MPDEENHEIGKGAGERFLTPQEKKLRAATKRLLEGLHRVPGLPQRLCGKAKGAEVEDHEVLAALASASLSEGPYAALSDAGMAEEDLEELEGVLNLLFPRGLNMFSGRMLQFCTFLKDKVKVFSFLLIFSGVITIVIGVVRHFDTEWVLGICWITGYDGDCQECQLQIRVTDANTNMRYLQRKYSPELRRSWVTKQVEMKHEPFRCCGKSSPDDDGEVLNCCAGFFDNKNDVFCDQWPHLSKDSEECPSGDWECSFIPPSNQVRMAVEVQDFRPYVDRSAFYMMMAGVGLCALGIIRLLARPVVKCLRNAPTFLKKVPARLKELKEARAQKGKKTTDADTIKVRRKSSKLESKEPEATPSVDRKPSLVLRDSDENDASEECISESTNSPPPRFHASELRGIITPLAVQKERKRKEWAASQTDNSRWAHSTCSDAIQLASTWSGFTQPGSTWHPERRSADRHNAHKHWAAWHNGPEAVSVEAGEEVDQTKLEESLRESFNRYRIKTPGAKLSNSQLGYRSWTRWSHNAPKPTEEEKPRMNRSCESFRTASSERRSDESHPAVVVAVSNTRQARRSRSASTLRNTADPMRHTIGESTKPKRSSDGSPPKLSSRSTPRWSVVSDEDMVDDLLRRTFG